MRAFILNVVIRNSRPVRAVWDHFKKASSGRNPKLYPCFPGCPPPPEAPLRDDLFEGGGRGASFFFQERCTSGFKPERPRASTWSGVMAAPQVAEDGSRGSRIGTAGFAGVGYPDCQGPRVPAARLRTPALVAAPPQGFPREGPGYRLAGRPNPPGSQRRTAAGGTGPPWGRRGSGPLGRAVLGR